MSTRALAVFLGLLGCAACTVERPTSESTVANAAAVSTPSTPLPRLMRDVAQANADGTLEPTHAPPSLRTTFDGRIGINVKVGSSNNRSNLVELFLLNPEDDLGPGPLGLAQDQPGQMLEIDLSRVSKTADIRQITVCDKATQLSTAQGVDTYQLMLYGFTDVPDGGTIPYEIDLPVSVQAAKSASASLASLNYDSVRITPGPTLPVDTVLEPMFTADGRLVVARASNKGSFQGFSGGNGHYNIFYSNDASDGGSCADGVAHFSAAFNPKPILYAPSDSQIQKVYGFAANPMRGYTGQVLAPDAAAKDVPDLAGTYPWIDRQGRNLFFYSVSATNKKGTDVRFAASCLVGTECTSGEDTSNTRGLSVMGSWTNGKAVLLDGMLNNIDYGYGISPGTQANVTLYAGSSGTLRLASGRENQPKLADGGPAFGRLVTNPTIVDSFENIHNARQAWKPQTPRDVVWKVSRGQISDEVAFDDFIDPNVLVFAPMNAVVDLSALNSRGSATYLDGWQSSTIAFQNAATTPLYPAPEQGTLSAGSTARVEPVALGGIHGRGLFLKGGESLTFPLQDPGPGSGTTPTNQSSWYAGFFVDMPSASQGQDALLTVGSVSLATNGSSVTVSESATGQTSTVTLAKPLTLGSRWVHLGMLSQVQSADGSALVTVLVNGNTAGQATFTDRSPFLPINWPKASTPSLQISGPQGGAWFDDLKLILNADWMLQKPEILCNHAGGSIFSSNGTLANATCHAPLDGGPMNTSGVSMRATIFGTDVLRYDRPRPGFGGNPFCLSCHLDSRVISTRPPALTTAALKVGSSSVNLENDPRRQPLIPPRQMLGHFPPGIFDAAPKTAGAIAPTQALDCSLSSSDLCNIDRWMFPAP